jgi:diaminopimelate decarboxylase
MHHFDYRGDELYCEEVPLARIAEQVGTPAYVYSHATLERHFRVFDGALRATTEPRGRKHIVCFSMKANSNLAVLRAMVSWGAGVDIVSGGELYRALKVGADPKKIVFSGVGKRDDEIEYAIKSGILAFNVESHMELEAIERVAGRLGARAPISLRVNPDVDAETHPYISTGLKKNKFGIPVREAREEYRLAQRMPHIEVVGIDCHIGSQLTKVAPFKDAIARVASLCRELAADGVKLRYLDIGGGLGISYNAEEPPSPQDYARAIQEALEAFAGLDVTLVCEPGRVIVGNAGVLLTRVLYLKQGEIKNFVIVDAAFNDLIRPAFYDSFHGIRPVKRGVGETMVADVVGPICETGDFLARDRELKRCAPGDLLAVMSAGAYGFSMASNYNSRPRAAEVMVKGSEFAVVRQRETIEDLVRGESVPAFLTS